MRLLGITGKVYTAGGAFCTTIGAGKDEVANRLGTLGYSAYALASPLKKMLSVLPQMELYKWDDRVWKEAPHPVFGATRRKMAQTLGTGWRNLIHPDLWLLIAGVRFDDLRELHPSATGMVISDVRFEHEAKWIRDREGRIIHVIRNNGGDPIADPHVSETGVAIADGDCVLYNFGSLEDLYSLTDRLAVELAR